MYDLLTNRHGYVNFLISLSRQLIVSLQSDFSGAESHNSNVVTIRV